MEQRIQQVAILRDRLDNKTSQDEDLRIALELCKSFIDEINTLHQEKNVADLISLNTSSLLEANKHLEDLANSEAMKVKCYTALSSPQNIKIFAILAGLMMLLLSAFFGVVEFDTINLSGFIPPVISGQ